MPSSSEDSSANGTLPDVTVVVIAYNDAERLPTAVGSVLDQTLHNLEVVIVDDASTDGTGDVAAEFAARDPERIRAITLPENSGGCSRPRNVGIEAARAPFVMFLDSDDELEPHAAKNLLLAAEETRADLVSGLCVRVNITSNGRRTKWYRELYRERAVYNGIREVPDLLFDTLCTNKLYRVDFLNEHHIRFPDGLHYEDLLFTTEAYCSAQGIALIPTEVYRWMVIEDAAEVSISNRRENLQNFADRIVIHRRIDAYLEAHGFDDLRVFKDRKFILQDLKLYLQELGRRDAQYQRDWLEIASAYLKGIRQDAMELAGPLPAAATYLVREGDLEGALDATELWVRGRLAGRLTVRDGRAYLGEAHLDSDEGRRALDVTALHLHSAPFSRRNLLNRLTSVQAQAGVLRFEGEVNDPLGDLTDEVGLSAVLELRSADGRVREVLGPATLTPVPNRLRWCVEITRATRLPRLPSAVARWELWLALRRGESINLAEVTRVPGTKGMAVIPWPTSGGAGRLQLRLEVSPRHAVVGKLEQLGRLRRTATRAWGRVRRSGVYHDARRLFMVKGARAVKSVVYRAALMRLPLRPDTAVFESHLGRGFSDSPKYVYLALRAAGDTRRVVWSAGADGTGWPTDASVVRRDSWRYYYELARAGTWVDNQGFPAIARRRRNGTYLQTWHGSPYKAMGYDEPQLHFADEEEKAQFASTVSRWTHFCVQSSFAEETFTRAFRHHAQPLRTGYPRNDPLLRSDTAAEMKELRARLELPDDRRLVLYAPTFRDYRRITRERYKLPLNLGQLGDSVGDSCFLLVRSHYLDRGQVPARHATFARDVSEYPDVTELLLLADALITDYSSIMFDYALLRRPMLFYAYDLDLYTMTRGEYFDLEAVAPGPVVRTEAEVTEWLADPAAAHVAHADRYERFLERFCEFETGHAARDVVTDVFGRRR